MCDKHVRQVGNGSVVMPLIKNRGFRIFGGPYRQRPSDMTGVKMAVEISAPAEINVPTRDYSVPSKADLDAGLIAAINCMTKGQTLYVGCMGGMGRTGLFLAVLAKAFGVKKPVEFIRANYYAHAVETKEQYQYVADYVIPPQIKKKLFRARLRYFFFRSKLEKA